MRAAILGDPIFRSPILILPRPACDFSISSTPIVGGVSITLNRNHGLRASAISFGPSARRCCGAGARFLRLRDRARMSDQFLKGLKNNSITL